MRHARNHIRHVHGAVHTRAHKSEDIQEQVKHAFRLVLCRQPNSDELKQSLEFMAPNSEQGSSKQDSLATLCLVLLNTNEFVYQN